MAPITYGEPNMEEAPMSRTHQYRKVMKPLLERKRRARINKCLDDLKDLMVFAAHPHSTNASAIASCPQVMGRPAIS